MADMVEASFYVSLQNPFGRITLAQPSVECVYCICRTSEFSESVRVRIRFTFRYGFQCHKIQCLHGSVFHGRYSQRSCLAVCLRYVDPFQWEGFVSSPCQRTYSFYFLSIGVPLYVVNPCRALAFIGGHFPYCQCLGFERSDKQVLQGFNLVVPPSCMSLCYSDLQLSDLAFTLMKVNVFPCRVTLG